MIILSLNIEERRDYRVQHCYPDIVFQRSHHVIHKHAESLGMEAIYASATLFSQFLLDNKIANPDYIGYEIDDLQVELPNMTDLLLLLTVTYLRLCCASKEPALSNEIAKGVKKYCFSMPCLTEQLKKMEDVKALFSHSPIPKLSMPPPQQECVVNPLNLIIHGNLVLQQTVQQQTNGVTNGGTGIQVNKNP